MVYNELSFFFIGSLNRILTLIWKEGKKTKEKMLTYTKRYRWDLSRLPRTWAKKEIRQGVTPRWKSVHRISGYQGYQLDIRGIINRYQEKIDQLNT